MARAARSAGRQAARLGLLAALFAACAVIQDPPGGPPDFAPPAIESVTPDSGSVVPEWDDPVVIEFDEVISEASGGGLQNLVSLSPRPRELRVSWKRSAIHVEPKEGWQPDLVYHVVLSAGVTDLRNNQMTEGRTIIFSTGGEIPDTRITGTVLDWESGRAGAAALIEAVLLPDSLAYLGVADSTGEFTLSALPRGTYLVSAAIDGNANRRRDLREAFDTVTVLLDSAESHVFWTFTHDTVGPRIQQLAHIDSVTVRVEFSQMLAPVTPDPAAVQVWALPDTTPVTVSAVWSTAAYDSVRSEEEARRAAADTGRAEAPDTILAPDTLPPRPPRAERPGREPPTPGTEVTQDTTAADTSRAVRLLAQRPALSDAWIVRLADPMTPGGRYLFGATATGIAGAAAESKLPVAVPEPRQEAEPSDSAAAAADSLQRAIPPDST